MTVTAPATSKARVSPSARLSAISRGVSAKATRLTGTLTQSTHSQPRPSVRMPPSRTPAAPPEPATAPQTPSALLRSAPSLKVVVTIESAAGEMIARAEALRRAGRDQLPLGRGEAGGERGDGDQQQAGHEDAAAAEQVGGAAAEQQEAAEGEHVGVDDPGQVLLGEVEGRADRRQRDVDDRGVEDDDELRRAEEDQGEPALLAEVFGRGNHYWVPSQANRDRRLVRARSGRCGSRSGRARPGRACRACASRWRGGSRPSSRRGGGSRRSPCSCAPRRRA